MGLTVEQQEQYNRNIKFGMSAEEAMQEVMQPLAQQPVQQVQQQAEQHFSSLLKGASSDVKKRLSKLKEQTSAFDRPTLATVPSRLVVGEDGNVYSAGDVMPAIFVPEEVVPQPATEKEYAASRVEAFGDVIFTVVEETSDQNTQYQTMVQNESTLKGFIQRALAENPNDMDALQDQATLNRIADMHAFGFGVRDYNGSTDNNAELVNLIGKYIKRFNKPDLTKFNTALNKVMKMGFRFDANLNVLKQRGTIRSLVKKTSSLNAEATAVKEKLIETAMRLLPLNHNVSGFALTPQETDVKRNVQTLIRIYNQQIANRLNLQNGQNIQVSEKERQFMAS